MLDQAKNIHKKKLGEFAHLNLKPKFQPKKQQTIDQIISKNPEYGNILVKNMKHRGSLF